MNYYRLKNSCIYSPLALTSNTKYISPTSYLYNISNTKAQNLEKNYINALQQSQRNSNLYEQHKLAGYLNGCVFCNK